MMILGLTGSIGMGKSTIAAMFAKEGVPVFDADARVHALYQHNPALIAAVANRFPATLKNGVIDRKVLARLVHDDDDALGDLEAIVHPAVTVARARWLHDADTAGHRIVLFDIPLLLEKGGAPEVDKIIVVSAPAAVQSARVLARPNMSAARLERILAAQMPDRDKRKRADFVIDSATSLEETARQVHGLMRLLRQEVAAAHLQ